LLITYFSSLPFFGGVASYTGIWKLLLFYAPVIMAILVFTLLYALIPNTVVPIPHAFFSAIFATYLFEYAKNAFTFYISNFSTYQTLYGTVGVIPIFLIWIYISWVIILFGAVVCNAMSTHFNIRDAASIDGFSHALKWLNNLWHAQQDSKSLSVEQMIQSDKCNYQIEPHELMQKLKAANLVKMTRRGHYLLACDLHEISLLSLYQQLPWSLPSSEQIKQLSEPWQALLSEKFAAFDHSLHEELDMSLTTLFKSS